MLSFAAAIGLVTSTAAIAQQRSASPYDQGGIGLSPGKSNCNSPTGCANYPSGDVTKANPAAKQQSSQGGDINPSRKNCGPDDATCANYPTGNPSKSNPSQGAQR
jgi:hypothetical protein